MCDMNAVRAFEGGEDVVLDDALELGRTLIWILGSSDRRVFENDDIVRRLVLRRDRIRLGGDQ